MPNKGWPGEVLRLEHLSGEGIEGDGVGVGAVRRKLRRTFDDFGGSPVSEEVDAFDVLATPRPTFNAAVVMPRPTSMALSTSLSL